MKHIYKYEIYTHIHTYICVNMHIYIFPIAPLHMLSQTLVSPSAKVFMFSVLGKGVPLKFPGLKSRAEVSL